MKNFKLTIALAGALTILLSSCGSSNGVVGNGVIQKRKYTKGFHLAKKSGDKSRSKTNKEEVIYSELNEVENHVVYQEVKETKENKIFNPEQTLVEVQNENNGLSDNVRKSSNDRDLRTNSSDINHAPIITKVEEKNQSTEVNSENIKDKSSSSSSSSSVNIILLIILAFLLPWLAVGLVTNWEQTPTLISVILWLLFIIPGIIYGLYIVLTRG